MNDKSLFNMICEYYEVSRTKKILDNQEALTRYEQIGCYGCSGTNKYCTVYSNPNINVYSDSINNNVSLEVKDGN